MSKKITLIGVVLLFAFTAAAQDTTPQMETFLGYTFTRANSATNVPAFSANGGSGQFVYDFNIDRTTNFDGPVDGFQLDPTGALTLLSPFTNLTLQYGGYFDQSGKYIFVHSSRHIGVWTVDGTTGNLTELSTGVNGVGDRPWTVTDPH